jgi:hypothetical protein
MRSTVSAGIGSEVKWRTIRRLRTASSKSMDQYMGARACAVAVLWDTTRTYGEKATKVRRLEQLSA